MTNFEIIEQKLQRFISKYYRNALIRGVILFAALGLLYFLVTVVIEYFLWLNPLGRTILFGLFMIMELFLLIRFVGVPLARLWKLSRGINFRDASTIIGAHFPEVSDKLINVLQLHQNGGDDELTWASINQKSEDLKPIPFSLAIDYKKNKKFLPYLAIPVAIIAGLFFTGNNEVLTDGAKRVADFNNEYIPPAPFTFSVINKELTTLQRRDFKLQVQVSGRKIPENVSINYNDQTYFLTPEAPGTFSFIFSKPLEAIQFQLIANEVMSKKYVLNVDDVPVINGFELFLNYPPHTGKADEKLASTGNAIVPQGTQITWTLNATKTTHVGFNTQEDRNRFKEVDGSFTFAKAVMQPFKYAISTSNDYIKEYETLNFKIDVVKDEYPELDVEMKRDSIESDVMYFKGQVADDYGIRKTQLVYYPSEDVSKIKSYDLGANRGTFDQFLLRFPGDIPLKSGSSYQLYFEVIDNDIVNDYKSTISEVFSYRKSSNEELEDQQFAKQKESFSKLEEAVKEQQIQQEKLDDISKDQLQKKDRSFNDKRSLDQALKNQQQQEQKMRQELEKMKDNLQKSTAQKDPMKELLEDRMQKSAEELKKNEELLKELREYQDKLSPEELKEKMDQSKKRAKQQKRNLEQLVELTKRYYVKQKLEQLGRELEKIAQKQKEQSEKEGSDNKKEDQDKLNEEYKDWEKELKELEDENDGLKKPLNMDFEPEESQEIIEEQEKASQDLKKSKIAEAKKKQKKAAQKMQQQAASMASQMSAMSQEGEKEDAESLRQILDNLMVFSIEEEALMESMKQMNRLSPNLGNKLKAQKDLERAFEHVDDSLFALAARNPKIGQEINKEVTGIYYYLEKSLEQMAEFQMQEGQGSQQFVFKGANTLAVMLSNSLDAMNNAIPMPGMGESKDGGPGFQLPNIIKKQESLSKSGEGDQPGSDGEEGKEGEKGSSGESGESGATGKNGESGESGEGGESGESGKSGEGGQSGEDGDAGEAEGSGGKSGSSGENGSGNAVGGARQEGDRQRYRESEEESKRIYEIYKQQQELRNDLEDMIRREGLEEKVGDITDKMKAVERQLLDQGFNREVQQRMMDIQQDLLKLQDAGLEQGEENKREARTNTREFINNINAQILEASKYFNNKEILNRQVLPLQPQYLNKVKDYFKVND
ncbi:hypothetical protein [Nonlabens sp.]|uniref:hypothetical protein n=1 Tax=Nonlabens sp. TaxID=1888209 RepID=UPI0025EAAA66|nr:hypothetical protein [Nonlabens sp.]